MTGAPLESLGSDGTRSLEVRWILPGQLPAAAAEWFGRFPAETTAVEDVYLLDPHLPGLSVKVRGGRALEVKVYRGSPGLLEVAGRARGRLESWQKWSFPHDLPSQDSNHPDGWQLVSKTRRISGSRWPVGPPGHLSRDWATSQGVRWNSPRYTRAAEPGGPSGSRQPAQPTRCAANSRPPPPRCSPSLHPKGWN